MHYLPVSCLRRGLTLKILKNDDNYVKLVYLSGVCQLPENGFKPLKYPPPKKKKQKNYHNYVKLVYWSGFVYHRLLVHYLSNCWLRRGLTVKIPTNNDIYIYIKIYICGFVYHHLLVHCLSNCCLKGGLPIIVRHSFVFSFQHVCIIFMRS